MTFLEYLKYHYHPRSTRSYEIQQNLIEEGVDYAEWAVLRDYLRFDLKAESSYVNGAKTVWMAYQYHARLPVEKRKWNSLDFIKA